MIVDAGLIQAITNLSDSQGFGMLMVFLTAVVIFGSVVFAVIKLLPPLNNLVGNLRLVAVQLEGVNHQLHDVKTELGAVQTELGHLKSEFQQFKMQASG